MGKSKRKKQESGPYWWCCEDLEKLIKHAKQMQYRETLTYIGTDLIIKPNGCMSIIEFNGQNSGTKGFVEAYGRDTAKEGVLRHLNSFGIPVEYYKYNTKRMPERLETFGCDNVTATDIDKLLLDISKESLGDRAMSDKDYFALIQKFEFDGDYEAINERRKKMICKELGLITEKIETQKGLVDISNAEKIIFNNTWRNFQFDENRFMLVNPYLIEWVLDSKDRTNLFAWPYQVKTEWIGKFDAVSLSRDSIKSSFQKYRNTQWVFKPSDGSTGEGVVIVNSKDLMSRSKKFKDLEKMIDSPEDCFDDENLVKQLKKLKKSENVIMQPLIPSRKFYNPNTKNNHAGCVRNISLVHTKNGKVNVYSKGSYIRLAPEPAGKNNDSLIANLSRGSCAIPLGERDQRAIDKFVGHALRELVRRSMRVDYSPGCFIQNYLFLDAPEAYILNGTHCLTSTRKLYKRPKDKWVLKCLF